MRISYPVARILCSVAEAEASRIGVPMAMAVTDENGCLLFFGRMDGALPAASEIAMGKAFTSAALRLPTEEVGRLAQPGEILYGIQHTHGGRIVLFGGGLPLTLQGKVVGGIGISGGTVEEDLLVARPVVATLERMEALALELKGFLAGDRLPFSAVERIVEEIQRDLLKSHDIRLPPAGVALISGALFLSLIDPG